MSQIQPEQISKYVVENSNEGIWIIDREMQIHFANRRAAEMFGCAIEEIKDANLAEFVFEADRAEILQKIKRQKPGNGEEFDFRFRRKDNAEVWARVLTNSIFDKGGEFIGTLFMLTDISLRRQSENAMNARENPLRLITDNLPALIAYVDAQHFYRFANETYKRWFGLDPGEIVGKHVAEIIGEAVYKAILPEIKKALSGEELFFERLLPYPGGSPRFVQINYIPDIDDKGAVRGYFAMILDISERREVEKNLEKSEERYRAFIEQSTEGIWRFELEKPIPVNLSTDEQIRLAYQYGYLAECNDAMARQYGFESAKDIIGARITDLLIETDEKNYEFLRLFIESGYRLTEAESHEKDSQGRDLYFLNNFVGFVENGYLLRAWGTQLDITERKKIGQTAAYLAAIVESSDDAIISKDLKGIITSWNKSAEKIFGYAPDEIVGRPLAILIPPERADEETEILKRIRNGERIEHYETVRRRKDGTDIDISLTVSPIRDESGKIIGASKIVRDITEQKRTQEILNENQMMLALAMQSSRMGVWWRDIATEVVFWSEELEEIFGLEKGAFSKTENGFYDLVHEDDRQLIWAEVETAIDERRDYVIEFRFYHADGSIRWMEGRGQAVYSEKGEPVRIYGIAMDITHRKQAEEALRESKERFSKAFNSSPLVFTITSLKTGKLIEVNETFVRVSGYTRGEAVGRTTAELGLWADTDERERELRAVLNKRQINNLECRFRLRDGTEFIGLLSAERIEIGGEPCALSVVQDITKRKKAEEISERYRLLSKYVRDVILFLRSDGKIIEANQAAIETYGYDYETLLQMNIKDLRSPATLPLLNKQLSEAALGNIQFETFHRRNDGSPFPVEVSSTGVEIAGERMLISIIRDITERQKAEEALRRSAKQLALVTNTAPVFIAQCDRERRYKFVNKANAERFGLKPEDFVGRFIPDVIGEAAYEAICPYIEIVLSGQPVEFEVEVPYAGIGKHFMHCSYAPELNENGEVIGWVAAITDITESKQVQEALIKAERKAAEDYQALLQRIVPLGQTLGTARDLISIYRAILEFVSTSMSCSAFFVSFYDTQSKQRTAAYAWGEGREVDISELPPMPLSEDGGPNSQAVFQKKTVIVNRYWDFMKTRPHVVLRENGVNPMSSLVVPMMIKNEVIGTLEVQAHENEAFSQEQAVALEMAANLAAVAIENVRLLEVEAEARRIAEDANRAKDEFLSVLSHELRTPLNSMLGWVRMLQAGMLDEQRTKQAIEVIERNTRLQNSLIEDLLDVSRIISGKMRIEKEEVDLAAITKNSCETLRPVAEEKNILFECTFEDESLMLEGDAVRLQQVISNLVQNAIKFTSEGKISVGLKKAGDRARLIVKDTGIGIEPDVLPHIFERFRQADASTRRSHSGLGLGLTIVSNLVELHGGAVRAASAGKGQGSTFIVELPLAEKYLNKKDETGSEAAAENNFNLKGARILLVDDDAESIVPLEMLLEREKAEVVKVFSADDALSKLTEQPFHILVSDIGMPEMDGYDLIAKIRKLTSEQNAFLPAIALTAYASNEDRRRALSAGFQMHFSKPFDFDELLSAIIQLYKEAK